MKKKTYSIVLASIFIIFLIFVSSIASASPEQNMRTTAPPQITSGAGDPSDDQVLSDEVSTDGNGIATESIQAAAPKIAETRITTNASEQYTPVIYGNKIAWEDYRNGNWDVYIYDLSTKKETSTLNASNQYSPDIYENRVVWTDERNGNSEIYLQDLSTKKQTRIITNEVYNWDPGIYGDKIVWTGYPGEDYEGYNIYMYDLSAKKEQMIAAQAFSPAIYGNRVVWVNDNFGYSDIYMYDLSTKKQTQITNNGLANYPAIYGNRIVWTDWRNENADIYMYDISTKKEKRITTNPSASYSPAIYGNRIVWMDDRNGNWDIYVYDLATRQGSHTTDKSDQWSPDIYGDKIVWIDSRNGNADIYMGTLSTSPVAAFSASPTSGKAPLKVTFTDKSTGSPTSWKWSFGDGKSSTSKSPAYTYSKAGKYTVSLTVKNAAGTNTKTIKNYITVKTAPVKPIAAFSATPTAGKAPLKVQFTDKSTNSPTSWKWSFGDGTYSTAKSPAHTYSKKGKYTVSLTVKNAAGSNTKTISGYVIVKSK
ncbi:MULTISPECIES: PKD domain-containing protein [unclassified Methanosarcina]|jgi:beta propeller repeat protein|uniref:PKD domain-containing protein n=1 Tax=unclassified Methanosarcina TaxID=2644672 RepID=UPI0025E6E594|nr:MULTISPECIES: PKD domain-containing protein [unclassified Methanosarcina]